MLVFSMNRKWLRIAVLYAVVAGVVIAAVASAAEPFRIPLGIALGVLVITLAVAFAGKRSSGQQAREVPSADTHAGVPRTVLRKLRGRKPVAAELALLAELHAKGALSDEEFSAAKRRTLGG
ncbi:hypothetical protein BIU82_11640 [Arthrobacter sp. SW1]|nr:hypothetical protein BIU82_11640 [Arthrobacter sp. SW1]